MLSTESHQIAANDLPHQHLVLPLGIIAFEFCGDIHHQKLESLGYRVALFA